MTWAIQNAKDKILHGGRFGKKRVMEDVYKNNIDVFRHWGYRLPSGQLVGLGNRKALLDGTKVYARGFDVNDVPVQECVLKIGCINGDCVDVAEKMINDGLNTAILNLASRKPVEEKGKFAPFYNTFGKWA